MFRSRNPSQKPTHAFPLVRIHPEEAPRDPYAASHEDADREQVYEEPPDPRYYRDHPMYAQTGRPAYPPQMPPHPQTYDQYPGHDQYGRPRAQPAPQNYPQYGQHYHPGTNGHAPEHLHHSSAMPAVGYDPANEHRMNGGRSLLDVDDPVTLRRYQLAGFNDPVKIPMRRIDWAFPFVLVAFVALIGCFWVTVSQMAPHAMGVRSPGAATKSPAGSKYNASGWWTTTGHTADPQQHSP